MERKEVGESAKGRQVCFLQARELESQINIVTYLHIANKKG